MIQNGCEQFVDKLVDYADGELPTAECSAVTAHLATCRHCRELLAALGKSLELTGAIWQAGEAELAVVRSPAARRPVRIRLRRPAAIAAGILLLLGGALIWYAATRTPPPSASPAGLPRLANKPPDAAPSDAQIVADAERAITRAGVAMQMLGAADFLAEQPGGREIARQRLQYIINTYPETTAAAEARSRVASQPERRT